MTNAVLTIPEDIYFGEEQKMLDFNEIREITHESRKKNVENRQDLNTKVVLTDKENTRIDSYIRDMEKHIGKFAADARDKFLYDCSKIESYIFLELAQKFKEKNSKFYVQTNAGTQVIVVDWSGKHEA